MVLRILTILWIFGLKYLMKLFGRKLYVLNTFNLWVFYVGLPLCYDVGDYPVFVTYDYPIFVMMSLWRVITPSLWQRVRLEAPTLHDTSKSLSVWVRLLLIEPKDHMQKGYCVTHHSLLPGEEVNSWVCGWG